MSWNALNYTIDTLLFLYRKFQLTIAVYGSTLGVCS